MQKKKKCKRDKKPFVGCVLSENGERKELLLGQDGALLRKAEESGAGRPSLYLSPWKGLPIQPAKQPNTAPLFQAVGKKTEHFGDLRGSHARDMDPDSPLE